MITGSSGVLMPYHEALARVLAEGSPLSDRETVAIEDALGRRAHTDVASRLPNPPFSNSSVDGFAIRTSELAPAGKSSRFEIAGRVCAGDSGEGVMDRPGACVEITTGAPLPHIFDAVVKVEDARRDGDLVTFAHRPAAGENVRFTGEDLPAGELLIRTGTKIRPQHLMALAASGIDRIDVRRRPKIALLSTGQEVIDSGRGDSPMELPRGKIFNSTAPFLLAALRELGAEPAYYGTVADDRDFLAATLSRMLEDGPDIIVTTGGVSVGLTDFVPEALTSIGAEILFHRVAIRPGKPLLFGRIRKAGKPIAIFGFPGNQISSVTGLRFFLGPFLRIALSAGNEAGFEARLSGSFGKPAGLTTFCLGSVSEAAGETRFAPWPRQMSFMLAPIIHSNAWAILPAERRDLIAGDVVQCRWLYPID